MASNYADSTSSSSEYSADEGKDDLSPNPSNSTSVKRQLRPTKAEAENDSENDHVEVEQLQKHVRRLQSELDEARSLVAVANYSLEESLETERRKCKEEVATLQQLMKGKELIFMFLKLCLLELSNI